LEVVGERGVVPLSGRKHRTLLAALAVAGGRACAADMLVDALWGERPPPSARKLLHVYVSQVRKALPDGVAIVTLAAGYALDLPEGSLDAARFEQLAGEAGEALEAGNPALAASLAEQGLALWRGPAYADVMYEGFARGEAERLEEVRLGLSETLLDARLRLGRHDDAVRGLLALAEAHPLRERVHELAMLALYRSGRQADALEHYAALRERLDAELGLEPGAGLRELQRRILQHDVTLLPASSATVASHPLPISATRLVGREAELRSLREILARREVRLLVLAGAGGSGKTRLALEVAREAAGTYANGAALVELAPLSDPELVLPTIAQRLDVTPAPGEELLETLVAAIRSRELLLVLDNAEHLREAAPLFPDLVARAPRLTLLVTSRAVLHVSGEHVFSVPPLEEEAAVDLFEQRARALAPAFRPTADDHASIADVCARVDRLPLAIELAAGRMSTLTLSALHQRLGNRLAILTGGPRDLPARQQTLRETLDWSVGLLRPPERAVLAGLAVFPGGATLDAAESVCAADLDTLTTLVDANLVRRVDAGDVPRFGLLETIREYALELLGDDRDETELALVLYFRDLVEEAYEILTEDPGWLARFDIELDNLRRALDVAASFPDPGLELQLAGGLWRFWWTRGYLDEGIARLEAALGRASEPSPERMRAARGVAGLAWSRGHLELAEARATEALALADDIDDPYETLGAHTILGIVANRRNDFERARRHHEQSLSIKERLGLEPLVERLNLGIVAMSSGDPGEAVSLFESVLESHRRNGNPSGIGFATLNLGLAHYELGDIEAARASFDEAGEAFSTVGFRAHVAHAWQGGAACAASSGRHVEAARLLGRAAAELGDTSDSDEDFPVLAARAEATARTALGDDGFTQAYEAGRRATDGPADAPSA
jgi:predicted ATPase/DNA-binding SARP family transcriptional activator